MHDVVKVVDFGIAQEIESTSARSGVIAGTPGYVAPEVITHGDVGAASYLYAVGAVAYFLLTGARVFDGDAMEQLVAHASATPAAPSTRCTLPAALDELVLACLEKDPARRPASARVMAAALEDIARELPWSAADAEAWWRGYEARRRPPDPAAPTADASPMTVDLRERA
jgi:serine/threonine-protein kinase